MTVINKVLILIGYLIYLMIADSLDNTAKASIRCTRIVVVTIVFILIIGGIVI